MDNFCFHNHLNLKNESEAKISCLNIKQLYYLRRDLQDSCINILNELYNLRMLIMYMIDKQRVDYTKNGKFRS